jgi:peroxiredoxin
MKKVLRFVSFVFFALALGLVSCASDSSDATEKKTETSESIASGEQTASAQAYAELQREVVEIQKTASTQQKMMEAMNQTAAKLNDFVEAYPGSEEAKDAKMQLALIHASLGNFEQAVPYLEGFIASGDENDERVGYAHFYLADAYKNLDRYDEAQKQYRLFVDEYSDLNPRFLAAATAALNDLPALKQLAVGGEPIPFTVKDIRGNSLSLESYKGKVVLLDFWATWCVPCKVEMPNVVRIHKKFNKRGFEIIGISLDKDREALDQFIKTNGMEWPQHFDGKGWQNGVAEKYKVRAIPATYLIDKRGKIRYRSLRGAELERAVERLLAET